MRLHYIILTLPLVCSSLFAIPQSISNLETTTVQVYTNNLAKVQKAAHVALEQGSNELTLTALPKGYIPNSLGVRILSDKPGVSIVTYSIEDVPTSPTTSSPELLKLQKEKQALLLDKEQLEKTRTSWLTTVSDFSKKEGINPEALISLADTATLRITSLNKALLDNQTNLEEVQVKLEFLQRSLATQSNPYNKQILLTVNSETPSSSQILIDYRVSGVSWSPTYKVNLTEKLTNATISAFAELQQTTGEPWANTTLVLNTIDLSQGTAAETLSPEWLEVFVPRVQNQVADRMVFKSTSAPRMAMMEMSGAAFDHEAASPTIGINSQTSNTKFTLPSLVSIPSNRSSTLKLPLYKSTSPTSTMWVTTPKVSSNVFIESTYTNSLKVPLLPGEAQLFIEDEFVGTQIIPHTAINKSLTLGFGIDDQIKVTREVKADLTETVGLTQSTTRRTKEFSYEITNTKAHSIKLQVTDQIPVSKDERIVIKLLEWKLIKPLVADKTGISKSILQLQPNQNVNGSLKFQVDYPSNITLNY